MLRVLSWIGSTARGVTRQHIEGFGVATIIFVGYLCVQDIVKRKETHVFHRSQTLKALHGGRAALERVLESQRARIDPSVLDTAEQQLEKTLENVKASQRPDFTELQQAVARLEMTGKEGKALEKLKEVTKDLNDEHKIYEIEMCIVELLIYMGNYQEALNQRCLEHQEITDARRPFFKTIIHLMLDQVDKAKQYWNQYEMVRDQFSATDMPPSGLLHEISHDFELFKGVITNVKKEIDIAKEKRQVK